MTNVDLVGNTKAGVFCINTFPWRTLIRLEASKHVGARLDAYCKGS